MVIATWEMSRIGSYRQVREGGEYTQLSVR